EQLVSAFARISAATRTAENPIFFFAHRKTKLFSRFTNSPNGLENTIGSKSEAQNRKPKNLRAPKYHAQNLKLQNVELPKSKAQNLTLNI
ncbi:MAG: hypothetical protein ABJF11_00005, partial [Reichenbachiella sp.]|uniref:hypothetical protein n=1 Tax=Reichenbachiella sp. TaxID=2184521 RepID=UPI003267A148